MIRFEQDYLNDPKWRIFRKAIVEDGKITWSERYTPEDIADKRSLLGEISFNQNMLLVPYSGGDSIIKRHYIRYGRCDHFDKIVIGADPAISERTMADNFGIVVT